MELVDDEALTNEPPPLSKTIEPVITIVRAIINKFRRSPVKNDSSQEAVLVKHKIKLSPLKDCKTRWSSLLAALERFDRISDAVYEVLDELELGSMKLNAEETLLLKYILRTLAPFNFKVCYMLIP